MNKPGLNNLSPGQGARKAAKRLGCGHSAGQGKTCGRGHKGQKSRSGGFHKTGFEGGQMPLQRRLPKIGFRSRKARQSACVRLHELARFGQEQTVDLDCLKQAKLVPACTQRAKVILSGELSQAVRLKGIHVTKGAREVILQQGGSIEE